MNYALGDRCSANPISLHFKASCFHSLELEAHVIKQSKIYRKAKVPCYLIFLLSAWPSWEGWLLRPKSVKRSSESCVQIKQNSVHCHNLVIQAWRESTVLLCLSPTWNKIAFHPKNISYNPQIQSNTTRSLQSVTILTMVVVQNEASLSSYLQLNCQIWIVSLLSQPWHLNAKDLLLSLQSLSVFKAANSGVSGCLLDCTVTY